MSVDDKPVIVSVMFPINFLVQIVESKKNPDVE